MLLIHTHTFLTSVCPSDLILCLLGYPWKAKVAPNSCAPEHLAKICLQLALLPACNHAFQSPDPGSQTKTRRHIAQIRNSALPGEATKSSQLVKPIDRKRLLGSGFEVLAQRGDVVLLLLIHCGVLNTSGSLN